MGNYVMKFLRLRTNKSIIFNELLHPFIPNQLLSKLFKKDNNTKIREEFENKYKQRLLYLHKCALTNEKNKQHQGGMTGHGYKRGLAHRPYDKQHRRLPRQSKSFDVGLDHNIESNKGIYMYILMRKQ